MKKLLFIALVLTLVFAACNKSAFLSKMVGIWKVNTYIFDGANKTLYFDTTYRDYTLTLMETDGTIPNIGNYTIDWKTYAFSADSIIRSDTTGYDSVAMNYIIQFDTLRFVDTTITPYRQTGVWSLINSDEDLQLKNDSDNTYGIFRILDLSSDEMKLRKGNEEFYYKK